MHNQRNNESSPNMSRLRANAMQAKKRASRRRTGFLIFLIIAAIFAVLFLTPVFDIRAVNISGTERINPGQLEGFVQSVKGENLFTVNKGKLCNNISSIPYVKNVHAKRRIYPPSLDVTIEERKAVAYIASASGFVLIDEACMVLEVAMQPPADLAGVVGISPKTPTPGQTMDIDEEAKKDIIRLCIKELEPISDKIRNINITDTENISFDYDNRLRVICGSSIDFGDKMRLLDAVMSSNRLASNARGTIDLSVKGKAVHTP